MAEWIDGCVDGYMCGRIDGSVDVRVDRWMCGLICVDR